MAGLQERPGHAVPFLLTDGSSQGLDKSIRKAQGLVRRKWGPKEASEVSLHLYPRPTPCTLRTVQDGNPLLTAIVAS